MNTATKIMSLEQAAKHAEAVRKAGKKVVTMNGVFDLLSSNHIAHLEAAKAQGDLLFVAINSDASVRELKGDKRPIVPETERARMVAALACSDVVFLFPDLDPRPWLPVIRPDVHVNSAEYGKECIEAETVKEIGAELVLLPRAKETVSTTELIDLIVSRYR